MQTRKEYSIQFVSLGLGEHKFEFTVTDKFFENLDYSEIKQGNILVKVNLIRQSQMMILEFDITGTVNVLCDLCATEFDMPISGTYKLIVKLSGDDIDDKDDDIIIVGAQEHQLDLSQYIYEYVSLSLPINRIHPLDAKGKPTCNKEMLKKVQKFLTKEEKKDTTDPRWNDLKNIKLN